MLDCLAWLLQLERGVTFALTDEYLKMYKACIVEECVGQQQGHGCLLFCFGSFQHPAPHIVHVLAGLVAFPLQAPAALRRPGADTVHRPQPHGAGT